VTDTISMGGVSAASLTLMGEDTLVRGMPIEEERASGLIVPNAARESFGRGSEFYGVVVAVGPGRLVERGPSAEEVAEFLRDALRSGAGGPRRVVLQENDIEAFARDAETFVRKNTKHEHVPLAWKPGDRVLCRQGFGPEIDLREGRHHIVGRGNYEHGHGVIATWTPAHVHCWHGTAKKWKPADPVMAECCSCDETREHLETALPTCMHPGPRLAEAVLAAKTYSYKVGSGIGASPYELRPELDDGK
jgi:co-chaperonin GroES (HSP10)